jgi:predicted hydrocarbon binding protein
MGSDTPAAGDDSAIGLLKSDDGKLLLGSARVIVMTERAYVFLLRVIHEQAPQIVRYALYDMGYRTGTQLMEALQSRAESPEQAFRYFVETYRQAGYGDIEVVSLALSRPEAILRGRNLFEAGLAGEAGIYRSKRAVDHYSRGMLAGFLSVLAGKEVVCEEMACQYRGDAACEFVVMAYEN